MKERLEKLLDYCEYLNDKYKISNEDYFKLALMLNGIATVSSDFETED